MTEHSLDRMAEQAASRFEQAVERAADDFERAMDAGAARLERDLTFLWENNFLFRWTISGAELLAGAGLLAAAKYFADAGQRAACLCCTVTGTAVFAAALLRIVLYRGK